MVLKPQDVVVVLKLLSYKGQRPPFSTIGIELSLSPSEVHAAVQRGCAARLLHGPGLGDRPNRSALEEFLVHGVKYAFPAERGELTRGMPTSYAAPPLRDEISPSSDPPPVWPDPEGMVRGIAFEPLYSKVPAAAKKDPQLYELLALVDALREGRARERKIAEHELRKRLQTERHAEP